MDTSPKIPWSHKSELYDKIKKFTAQAIGDFKLIEEGDHLAVGVSGGKDSYTLLHILEQLRRRAPIHFRLTAVNVDAGYPGYRKEIIEAHLREYGFAHEMVTTRAYRIIETKRTPGTSYCSFCARLRRGTLYSAASRLGCNKIALGHHLDDFIETLLLNQFYSGRLAAMTPKLLAKQGQHTVIRPFVYVEEKDIRAFAKESHFPVICCACPVCGEADLKRRRMKQLLFTLEQENPQIKYSLLRAIANVDPEHLLDPRLRPF